VVAVRDTVLLRVEFHTPFRVATGNADDGADTAIDVRVPVPGSSLKGLMRATARDILGGLGPRQHGGDDPLVVEVFGDEPTAPGRDDGGSPWHWDDVRFDSRLPDPVLGNRIRIQAKTGTVADGALMVAQQLPPATGTAKIWRSGKVDPARLPTHLALLVVTARLVDGAGGDRRAGTGWVSLTPMGDVATDWAALVGLLMQVQP
jgi:CRISPR/Cas system CMR subunit Cmr4 (Cas7 group RAMP superfamily)